MLRELGILFKQEDEKQKEKETPEKSQKVREVSSSHRSLLNRRNSSFT